MLLLVILLVTPAEYCVPKVVPIPLTPVKYIKGDEDISFEVLFIVISFATDVLSFLVLIINL